MKKEELKNLLNLLEGEAKSENIDLSVCEVFPNEWNVFYEGKCVKGYIKTKVVLSTFDIAYRIVRRMKEMDNIVNV